MPEFEPDTGNIVPMMITAFSAASMANMPVVLGPQIFLGTLADAMNVFGEYRAAIFSG